MQKKILFQELQKLRQWWVWLLVIGSVVFNLYFLIKPALSPENFSFSLILPNYTWVIIFFSLLIIVLLYFMKMTTKITEDKITIKHMYVVKKDFMFKDIIYAKVITYGFVGYGIRYSKKHGTVYNMSGNNGLLLTLKNGGKYLLGTQKPEELERVVNKILK